MNLVLDDAEEYHMKNQTRKPLGEIPKKSHGYYIMIDKDCLNTELRVLSKRFE